MIHPTPDQERLRQSLAAWHETLSADHVEHDGAATFPWSKWELLRKLDVLRIPFGTEFGGLGHDLLTTMYVLEDLGYGCRDAGLAFSAVTHIVSTGVPLQRFGSPALQARYLPAVCDGSVIGAHAITEPEGGSDIVNMRTTAEADGDGFVLDGTKTFVTNGPIADLVVVYAKTDAQLGPFGLTAFCVERDTPGLSLGPPIDKMGLRTSPFGEVVLERCRVPREAVLGTVGGGFLVLDHVMKWEILCTFVATVGRMQHRLERCIEHARTRVQFGRPIGAFQSISNQIVEMRIGTETARRWLYDTAERFTQRADVTVDVAISKLLASESNVASALAAIQIFGGRGYVTEHGLEKELRDAVSGTIYSGTSEVQRQRIAKMLELPA